MSNHAAASPARDQVVRLAEHQQPPPPQMQANTHGLSTKSAPRLRCGCRENFWRQGRALRVGDQAIASHRGSPLAARGTPPWHRPQDAVSGHRPPPTVAQPRLQSRAAAASSARHGPVALLQLAGQRQALPFPADGRLRKIANGQVSGRGNPVGQTTSKVLETRREQALRSLRAQRMALSAH